MTRFALYIWAITIALLAPSYGSATTIAAEIVDLCSQTACVESQPGTIPKTLEGDSLATTILVTPLGESVSTQPTSSQDLQAHSGQIDRNPSNLQLSAGSANEIPATQLTGQ